MGVPTLRTRSSGVLLHPTSLPGPHGSGDLGAEARAFVDFLAASGQRWWQMLPVGPAGYGDSPYSAESAFAGSPLLVDLDTLGVPMDVLPADVTHAVDYEAAHVFRERHLRRAWEALRDGPRRARAALEAFVEAEAPWLDDWALYAALKRAHGRTAWTRWERALRRREPPALTRARKAHEDDIGFAKFVQWRFAVGWRELRAYAHDRGVSLMGDLPLFVAHDSADVWQHQQLFELDEDGAPTSIAGVPPDYFSATGQRWGNPLYLWDRMAETGFTWWVDRFERTLGMFDAVRLDHFIGFTRFWKIPAAEPTAVRGAWVAGPGRALFDAVKARVGELPLVAEDLGVVTPEVTRLRVELELPGIRILQFAFGSDPQAPKFFPHAHVRRCVVYTGTHDNDTIVGWFEDPGGGPNATRTPAEAAAERARALEYLGREGEPRPLEIHWEMIRLALGSVARTVILPMQDVLGLGTDARMNRPGQAAGNWRWRLDAAALTPALAARLLHATRVYGRAS